MRNLLVACIVASASMTGCWYGASDIGSYAPNSLTGKLSVEWSVSGSGDPRACSDQRAASMQVAVYDLSGNLIANQAIPCNAFAVELSLPVGDYRAEATLLDAYGSAVSTTLPIDDIQITEGTMLTITTDFPGTAFY